MPGPYQCSICSASCPGAFLSVFPSEFIGLVFLPLDAAQLPLLQLPSPSLFRKVFGGQSNISSEREEGVCVVCIAVALLPFQVRT